MDFYNKVSNCSNDVESIVTTLKKINNDITQHWEGEVADKFSKKSLDIYNNITKVKEQIETLLNVGIDVKELEKIQEELDKKMAEQSSLSEENILLTIQISQLSGRKQRMIKKINNELEDIYSKKLFGFDLFGSLLNPFNLNTNSKLNNTISKIDVNTSNANISNDNSKQENIKNEPNVNDNNTKEEPKVEEKKPDDNTITSSTQNDVPKNNVDSNWKPQFTNKRIELGFQQKYTNSATGKVGQLHNGIDFAAEIGTPVESPISGEVVKLKDTGNTSYGKFITIKDENGNHHYFAHLSEQKVTMGQKINRGDLIGKSGNSGGGTGPHLHYEVRGPNDSTQINPSEFL